MTITIMAAVLFGAFLHALWNALVRSSQDRLLDTGLIVAGSTAIGACLLPFVPLPSVQSLPYLAASAAIHTAYFFLVARAYGKGQLSAVYPIMRGTAPLISTIAAALLLKEYPSPSGWAGVILIFCGIILLSLDSLRLSESRASILPALFNACVIVLYTLVDGIGIRLSGHALSYTGWVFFINGLVFILILAARDREATAVYFRQRWRRGLFGGICTFGSYGLALWAMTAAPIAMVAALRETSVIFALLIAAIFLKERITPMRYVSVLTVTAGALAIKFS
jgi:drug/metabolite transporter (DMT)-like permease